MHARKVPQTRPARLAREGSRGERRNESEPVGRREVNLLRCDAVSRLHCALRAAVLPLLLLVAVCAWARPAAAHAASDGYLTLVLSSGGAISGQWDVAVADIDSAMPQGPGETSPRQLSQGDVLARKGDIMALTLGHLVLRGDGAPCPTTPGEMDLTEHGGKPYVALAFTAACPRDPDVLALDYTLFFDKDPQHRGLTHVVDGATARSILFSSGYRHEEITRRRHGLRAREAAPGAGLASAIAGGVAHIATGVDHVLFLVALLLPAVLRRHAGEWQPMATARPALLEVAKIVTAFTIAHSLTLGLAVFDVVRPSPRFVEPAIAASIVVAAAQNVAGRSGSGRWKVAFALGLLHGFGFSSAVVDLGLRREDLATTLFGFNLGVELGQLAIVALVFPVTFALRRWVLYRRVVLQLGSLVIAVVAGVWFVQRALPSATVPGHAFRDPALVRPSRTARRGARDGAHHRLARGRPDRARGAGAAGPHPAGARALRRPAVRGVDPGPLGRAPPP
jgi:hypothetical protein